MDIDILLKKLSWHMPKHVQEAATNELSCLSYDKKLPMLLQPNHKDCWENATIGLKKIGYPRIEGIIYGLITWLQDINWPGAYIVIDILSEVDKEELLPHIERALIEACYDDSWIYGIRLLVDATKLTESDFSSSEITSVA
ncbi:hypothetical protein Psfp_01959 [Pelotomaculum sp. FP]|uniref:DUF5071 domain-containing protein n=1 Tax=Pelotomaculum sp. FP TaxID=261474 RepID=UPI0010670AB1|nr:DUF5071 domain-containing protein [Pelotomaculum sp. FP]TEB15728.1 hypothetical protein Psfp_01959 [Pelotomaculum sp. FP]